MIWWQRQRAWEALLTPHTLLRLTTAAKPVSGPRDTYLQRPKPDLDVPEVWQAAAACAARTELQRPKLVTDRVNLSGGAPPKSFLQSLGSHPLSTTPATPAMLAAIMAFVSQAATTQPSRIPRIPNSFHSLNPHRFAGNLLSKVIGCRLA